jgi:hypothetical protein
MLLGAYALVSFIFHSSGYLRAFLGILALISIISLVVMIALEEPSKPMLETDQDES